MNNKHYQIGQFSRVTRITVKALRHYQELGILTPTYIDDQSGYRYYSQELVEKALTIQALKALDFSLQDVASILQNHKEDEDMAEFLHLKANEIRQKLSHYKNIKSNLDLILSNLEQSSMSTQNQNIVIKEIPDQLVAGVRYKGRYDQIGGAYKKIYKAVGFNVSGKPGALYYDEEFKEEGADIEAIIPIKKKIKKDISKGDVSARVISGGKAYCITHVGPYDRLHQTYKKIMDHLVTMGVEYQHPSREVYLKGPGMIFKGNPEKYVTEIQFLET